MKLYVTIGSSDGASYETSIELPEGLYAAYLGLEIDGDNPITGTGTGRLTVVRIPFHTHGKRIHSVCTLNGEVEEISDDFEMEYDG